MTLRILGGEARGRVIASLKADDLSVRPILARIKKSLFDIIRPRISDADFLDLFSGTGAVGLEALSLGARYVDFVDGDRISIGLVKKNLETFGWKDRAGVHQSDATRNLGWLRRTYSVIFMGPPYKDREKRMLALSGLTLRAIVDGRLATPDTWIICQHHAKEPIAIPEELEQFREEKYGDTLVTFYRLKRQEQ